MTQPDPHASQPILHAGPTPESADATLLLVHGRGADAQGMLDLYTALDLPRLAALAPQAAGHTWYPHSFLAKIESNQPYLDSALRPHRNPSSTTSSPATSPPTPSPSSASPRACLTLEFAARNPRPYGAITGLTGGLIGPPAPRNYPGSFDGTPVFLGSRDPDPHVPFPRVTETDGVLTKMHAAVELRRYPNQPHAINQDEFDATRTLLQRLLNLNPEPRTLPPMQLTGIHHLTAITADAPRQPSPSTRRRSACAWSRRR